MQLRDSYRNYFHPNETFTLPDFIMDDAKPYLLIVSATYASSACYIGILSLAGGQRQELVLRGEYITPHVSLSGTLEIEYNPPEGVGAQTLHINIIRLS